MFSHLQGQREALKTQCWEQTKTLNESQTLEKKIQSNDGTVLSAIFHNANILHSYDVEHTYCLGQ